MATTPYDTGYRSAYGYTRSSSDAQSSSGYGGRGEPSNPRYGSGEESVPRYSPNWRWWIPAEGISRDVIQADIQRYLGSEALVRPGYGTGGNDGVPGYYIAAYRNLTSSMIQDLKADSANWSRQARSGDRYEDSQTHQSRQYWGPTGSGTVQTSTNHSRASATTSASPGDYYTTQGLTSTTQAYTQRDYYSNPTSDQGYGSRSVARPGYYIASDGREYPLPENAPSDDIRIYSQDQSAYQPERSDADFGKGEERDGDKQSRDNNKFGDMTARSPRGQARPGYYIASDGREYPLAQMPTRR